MMIRKIYKCSAVAIALLLLLVSAACRPSNSSVDKNTDTLKAGKTGNCEWELDMTSGHLTITGDGYMKSVLFHGGGDQPWNEWKSDIRSISLEGNIKDIPSEAFSGCVNLGSIDISPSVREIDQKAFYCCVSLKEINLPSGVESIGDSAFEMCTSLVRVKATDQLRDVGRNAFSSTPFEKNNIFGGAFFVGECLVYASDSIEGEYTVKSGTRSISSYAFNGCDKMTSVVIPSSVSNISYGAFKNCSALEKVNIPTSIDSINSSVFWGCTELRNIDIPSSIKSIDAFAFKNCPLSEVTVSKSCEVDEDAFDEGVTVIRE